MRVVLVLLLVLWMSACAGMQESGRGKLEVGQTEAELVAQRGQPQEILSPSKDKKVYVYTTQRLDQPAGLGGGVWGKPVETHYHINDEGLISKVDFYPYGKRNFIFPREEGTLRKETATSPEKMTSPAKEARESSNSALIAQGRSSLEESQGRAIIPPTKEATLRLELNMDKEEVQRLLGQPKRTEGFFSKGRPIVVWFYALKDNKDEPYTLPLVFQEGRLIGWGERRYQQLDLKLTP